MKDTPSDRQLYFMSRALELARRGRGKVSPNPLVGAVVVRDGRIVGEGFHLYEERDHAEVVALNAAGEKALNGDLYLTLEPCFHQGRTPPCVDRIIQAGVRRVFVATRDPNPLVSGRGVRGLKESGIEVRQGLLENEATKLNESFFHFILENTPFVQLKLAMTLDGKIATAAGESKWITGPRARQFVQRLRYDSDAILVGINTVLQDDPSLDVRWPERKPFQKVVLDSRLRLPPESRLFRSGDPVLVFCDRGQDPGKFSANSSATVIPVRSGDAGLLWRDILEELGRRKIVSLLVEGGAHVAASALRAGFVNKLSLFYAPRLLGCDALSGVGDLQISKLDCSFRLRDLRIRHLPPDFLVEAYPESGIDSQGSTKSALL